MNHSDAWIDGSFEKGLVSVIMPAYNRARLILPAVESVFRQDYRPLELIIADDGSSDNTEDVVTEWLTKVEPDTNFRLLYTRKPNGGPCSARNWAIRRSQGEFIQYLDSDDCLLPGAVRQGVERLEGTNLPYVYARVQIADSELNRKPGEYFGLPFAGNDADYTDYLWHTMGALFRRSTIKAVGPWDESLLSSDDWEYFTRVKLLGFRGEFDPTVVGLYRDHQDCRVVTDSFKPKYVLNVEMACDRIVKIAEERNCLSFTVRKKVALRLVIHAIQFGMNEHRVDCLRLLEKAQHLLPRSAAFQAGISLLKRFAGGTTCTLLWRLNEMRLGVKT